jgi:hypothetical protein
LSKLPRVICPAGYARVQNSTGNTVVVCEIIRKEYLKGESNYPNFEIVPENCKEDRYLECSVWREECDKGWRTKIGSGKRYTDIKQMEKITI